MVIYNKCRRYSNHHSFFINYFDLTEKRIDEEVE